MKKQNNKEFYKKSLKKYGVSAQGVHWNSKYTQYKRFEIITKLIKKEIQHSSLVDVGCGFAEYYTYLTNKKKLPIKYIGIDCENSMVEISKKRFPDLEFYKQDILTNELINADYYISSGALNILNKEEVTLFIKRCFEHVQKGFVFNYLKNITFNKIQKNEIIEICKKLTPNVTVKDGYLNNDFTILMVK